MNIKEKPILFNGEMVRAILDGRKTQTRRIVKPEPSPDWNPQVGLYSPTVIDSRGDEAPGAEIFGASDESDGRKFPFGKVGDQLWVRETWRHTASDLDEAKRITEDITSGTAIDFAATHLDVCMRELYFSREEAEVAFAFENWLPSRDMPRWASRIQLEITNIRIERLQNISEADAKAEGAPDYEDGIDAPPDENCEWSYGASFLRLWESINGAGSWDANPWVWVIEFKQVRGRAK